MDYVVRYESLTDKSRPCLYYISGGYNTMITTMFKDQALRFESEEGYPDEAMEFNDHWKASSVKA